MILEEFDTNRQAIINPEDLFDPIDDFPKTAISCFARTTFQRLVDAFDGKEILTTSMANIVIPIYRIKVDGTSLALFNSPVGAPACVAILEDLQALGMKNLVLFGTCGVLDEPIQETSLIIPTSAIRDEGTSYHYLPASREVPVNEVILEQLTTYLDGHRVSYRLGKVWTTDGIYRETVGKMTARKSEGAICVDMECSAVAAWADFRQVKVCHFFYAADHLSEENWDIRSLSNDADLDNKDKIAQLAIRIGIEMETGNY